MAEIKIRIMVADVKAKWPNESYLWLPKFHVRNYLMKKFEVSKYLAEQTVKKLYEDGNKN